jgi:drug/metabolite transporter (DMT)-like permease
LPLAQLCFSGFHVVGKLVLVRVPALAVASLRVAVATPVMLLWAWIEEHTWPRLRDLPILSLLGLLGVCANQLLFISGLERTTATHAAILMPSVPAFAVAVAALLRVEPLNLRRVGGVALSVAGALVMLRPDRFSLGDQTLVGDLLLLANGLAFAFFLVLQRPVLARIPWRTVIAWSFLTGGAGVLAVGGPALLRLELGALPGWTLLGLGYIIIFATLGGYLLNTWAVRQISSVIAAAYTTLQPPISAALAAIVLGERLGWAEGAGGVLIVLGLRLASREVRGDDRRVAA